MKFTLTELKLSCDDRQRVRKSAVLHARAVLFRAEGGLTSTFERSKPAETRSSKYYRSWEASDGKEGRLTVSAIPVNSPNICTGQQRKESKRPASTPRPNRQCQIKRFPAFHSSGTGGIPEATHVHMQVELSSSALAVLAYLQTRTQ